MARQFQGYARGRGFSSRSPGAGAVSRIQEQGNKTIQGLKEQLQSKRQKDQQYIADLDSNFRRDQAIKGEIKQFEDKAFALKMSNIKQNQEQSLRNIEVEAEKQARVFEQLSKFAPTLGETIVDVKDAFDEANDKAAFANSIFNFDQLSSPPSDLDAAAEEQLFKANATAETSNQQSVKENGLPQSTAQAQNKQSHYRQLKNTDARIAALGSAFRERATFDNHGIGLLHDLIEEFGLYGVRQQRFYQVAQDISKIQAGFQAENRRVSAINTSSELVTTALNQLIDNPSISNARNFYQTLSTSTEDGRSALTRPQVLDKFFTALENTNLTHDQVELIMGMEMIDEYGNGIGETFLQRHGKGDTSRYQTLLNNRAKARIDSVNLRGQQLQAEQKDNYLKARNVIEQTKAGSMSYFDLKQGIDVLDVDTNQRNLLYEEAWEQSKDYKESRPFELEADYRLSTGQSIRDILPKIRGPRRDFYVDANNKQQALRQDPEISEATIKAALKADLVDALGQRNIGDDKSSTLHLALDDSIRKVESRAALISGGTLTKASILQALGEIQQQIQSKTGHYTVKGMGLGGAENGNQPRDNYFSYYAPGGEFFTSVVQQNPSQALLLVRNRPDARKDTLLMPQENYARIYNALENGESYEDHVPDNLKIIDKAYPGTLQLQMDLHATKAGKPRLKVPLTHNQYLASKQKDKTAQRYAQQMETIQEERIFVAIADQSLQMNDMFKSPYVQRRHSEIKAVRLYEPLLSRIRSGEGGWTSANRGRAGDTPGGIPGLDRMTAGQWKDLQSQGYFALGAYQFIPSTFAGALQRAGMSDDTVMNADNQSLLAIELISGGVKRPVLSGYLDGAHDDVYGAANDLANEWAAVKNSRGVSAYEGIAGNSASIPQDEIVQLLMQLREAKLSG
jgi:hypothetical protein